MKKELAGSFVTVSLIRERKKKIMRSKYPLSSCLGYVEEERMKNIFNIQIERDAEYSSAFPWNVKVENPIFSIQKRFVLLSEVLAWLIEEVEKE